MRQIRTVTWDLMAWLPLDPGLDVRATGTGLSGDKCWHSVFGQSLCAQLLMEIVQHPAELVMLQLRCH